MVVFLGLVGWDCWVFMGVFGFRVWGRSYVFIFWFILGKLSSIFFLC